MAVVKTGAADGGTTSPVIAGTPSSFSTTVASDADYLIVAAGYASVPPTATVASVTFGGVAMTLLLSMQETGVASTSYFNANIFGLKAPPTGTNTLLLNINSGAGGTVHMDWCQQGFKGVDQTTPATTNSAHDNSGSSTTAAVGITTGASDWTLACFVCGSAITAGSSVQNQLRLNNIDNSGGGNYLYSDAAGTGGTVNHGCTLLADYWTTVIVNLKAAVTAAPAPPFRIRNPRLRPRPFGAGLAR